MNNIRIGASVKAATVHDGSVAPAVPAGAERRTSARRARLLDI